MKKQQLHQEVVLGKLLAILALTVLVACQTEANRPPSSSPTTTPVQAIDTTPAPVILSTLAPAAIIPTPVSTLTAPPQPELTGPFDHLFQSVTRTSDAIYVQDSYAYLNIGPVLVILDVSNPQSPHLLGAVKLPVEIIFNLYVRDRYAYVAAAERGLRIVDISNPAQPVEVGVYQPPLSGEISGFPSSWGFPSYDLFHRQGARGVVVDHVAGQVYAYVAALGAGLRVVNVSDPTQPLEVGVLATSDGGFVDVAMANQYLYLAKPGTGIQIVNISKPTTPQAISVAALDWPNEIWSITLSTNQADPPYVYGAAGTCVSSDPGHCPGMLHVIEVTNPAAPKTFSSSPFQGYSTNVAVSHQHAYLLAESSWHVLDISDPTQPQGIILLADKGGKDMAVANDRLYVAGDGLQIFDLGHPTAPVPVGQWRPPGEK